MAHNVDPSRYTLWTFTLKEGPAVGRRVGGFEGVTCPLVVGLEEGGVEGTIGGTGIWQYPASNLPAKGQPVGVLVLIHEERAGKVD